VGVRQLWRDRVWGRCYNVRVTKITGHFDGRVVVPDDAAKLKPNQTVTIEGEPSDPANAADPEFGTVAYVARHMKGHELSDEDAAEMKKAIEEAFETIDPDPGVNFD
jgi:hypothetical protein